MKKIILAVLVLLLYASTSFAMEVKPANTQHPHTGVINNAGDDVFCYRRSYTKEQSMITMLKLYCINPILVPETGAQTLYPMSAPVNGQYLWGYIDGDGEFVIQPQYAYASEWNGEYGIVALPESPGKCNVVDRAGTVQVFELYEGGTTLDTFDFHIDNGVPSVRFIGNCVLMPTVIGGRGESVIFSLLDHKLAAEGSGFVFSDEMISCYLQDNNCWFDRNGKNGLSAYGQGGAFYDGVAVTWGCLIDKQGETVYEYDFSVMKDTIRVYGIGTDTFVGDSLIFEAGKPVDSEFVFARKRGVVRADGTVILPCEYDFLRLTPCKQILTGKNGETYRLRDAKGKEIYKFPGYMTGAFHFDGSGYYMYRGTDHRLIVLSTTGKVTATIPVAEEAKAEFISDLIQITDEDGGCRYYDMVGALAFAKL